MCYAESKNKIAAPKKFSKKLKTARLAKMLSEKSGPSTPSSMPVICSVELVD